MRLGGLVKGALRGVTAARLGTLQGRQERRKLEADDYDRELQGAEHLRRRKADDAQRERDAVRLDLERRRTAVAEQNAATARTRATKPTGGGKAASQPQWKSVAGAVSRYEKEGMPTHIANIRARMEHGGSVSRAEMGVYNAWKRKQAAPTAGPIQQELNRSWGKKGNINLK